MKETDLAFFRSFKNRILKEINVMQLCRVVTVKGARADVQPMALKIRWRQKSINTKRVDH